MSDVNKVFLSGRLTRDAEVRYTQTGRPVATLGVATSEGWKGKDGADKESTEFHRVTAWGKLADACKEHGKKGARVWVEGKLQTREWEGKDGKKNKTTEIVAEAVVFVGCAAVRDAGERPSASGEYQSNPPGRPGGPGLPDRNGGPGPAPLPPAGDKSEPPF